MDCCGLRKGDMTGACEAVMNLPFHKMRGIFQLAEALLASQERLCCVE